MKLPDDAAARLAAELARGQNWMQAAIWVRHELGHPDERWLDQLFKMAREMVGAQ